jgi:WhiB family transcriptional regulator, redox-sensing transcriptional regulator
MIVSAEAAANAIWVRAIGTTRRLQALVTIGHSQAYLCERLLIPPKSASRLFCGGRTLVQAATARRVVSLFAELQSMPGPDDRSRRRAARRGWQPPLAWDTDSIDDPAASPKSGWQQLSGVVEPPMESAEATPQDAPAGDLRAGAAAAVWSGQRNGVDGVAGGFVTGPTRQRVALVAPPKARIANKKWRNDALCCQTDPEAFFPEQGDSGWNVKRVCMQCPVRMPCLEWALDHDERFGIWGGLSERQRRRLQNKVYNLGGNERRHLLAEHMWPTTNTADQDRSA